MKHFAHTALALCLLAAAVGCDEGSTPPTKLAPSADKLDAPKTDSKTAVEFDVEKAGSKVEFTMDAPIEKIRGKVTDAAGGNAQIDLTDLTKSRALLTVDISGIELYQRKKAKADDAEYGEEVKNATQNEHARAWLEINDENKDHDKHRSVQFAIKSVKTDTPDVSKMSGDERKVKATVSGEFKLHGHKSEKTADIEITFKYKDGKPVSLRVVTVKPFTVALAEHDVMPRDTVGKILEKGLSALSEKVAKDATVSIDFTASAKGTANASAPAESAAPSAAPSASAASSASAAPSASASAAASAKPASKK
jgi:hypothetical protein